MSARLQQDELAVYGYVRQEAKLVEMEIPGDIMSICLLWYHIKSLFFKAGKACVLNEDKTRAEYGLLSGGPNCCYGSVVMPSISNKDIEYKFTIKIVKGDDAEMDHIAVGIDDAECEHTDSDFAGTTHTKNYAYYSLKGTLFSHDTGILLGEVYGERYGLGDCVTMSYNPYKRKLVFYKNDVSQGVIENIYGDETLSYRLCILMGYCEKTCVELVM